MANLSETTADNNMESCLQNTLYEILYEIFCRLPKDKLNQVSRLCSRFRDVAGDIRLWKNVFVKHRLLVQWDDIRGDLDLLFKNRDLNFEDLYSEPWPVKVYELRFRVIFSPVSSNIGQIINVTTLDLSKIDASSDILDAILTKYQCTELILDGQRICDMEEVAPKAFLKQTALEVLSLRYIITGFFDMESFIFMKRVTSFCKNLKSLDLSENEYTSCAMLCAVIKKLPASLEKLNIAYVSHKLNFDDSVFKLLAENTPNLRDLQLDPENAKSPCLFQIQLLETLRFPCLDQIKTNADFLCMNLIKLPALKTVHIVGEKFGEKPIAYFDRQGLRSFRTTLENHGISVKPTSFREYELSPPKDNNFWEI